MRLLWKSAWIILFLVQFCRAVDLSCTSARSGNLMIYNIDKSQLSEDQFSRCDYSFNNSSMVLATSESKHTPEMINSLGTLKTSECVARLDWKAHCMSKETQFMVDFTATCITSCAENEDKGEDKGEDKYGPSGAVIVTASVVLIVFILLLIFLGYKLKKKICSGGCSQCGGLYSSVKTQSPDPIPLQVVVENK